MGEEIPMIGIGMLGPYTRCVDAATNDAIVRTRAAIKPMM